MNAWLVAAAFLPIAFVPCAVVAFRYRDPLDRLVALEMATVILVFELILLAQGMKRPSFYDLPLALSLLSFGGGLAFAHFLARLL